MTPQPADEPAVRPVDAAAVEALYKAMGRWATPHNHAGAILRDLARVGWSLRRSEPGLRDELYAIGRAAQQGMKAQDTTWFADVLTIARRALAATPAVDEALVVKHDVLCARCGHGVGNHFNHHPSTHYEPLAGCHRNVEGLTCVCSGYQAALAGSDQ